MFAQITTSNYIPASCTDATDGTPTAVISRTSGSTHQPATTSTNVPALSPPTEDSSSTQPPFVLIIGSLVTALVLLILLVLGLLLVLRYRQLRFGKRRIQLENPTYQGEGMGDMLVKRCTVFFIKGRLLTYKVLFENKGTL